LTALFSNALTHQKTVGTNVPDCMITYITFFFFFRRYNFILWKFWPSHHTISTYCDPGCS